MTVYVVGFKWKWCITIKGLHLKKLYYILYETTIYYYVLYYSIRYTLLKSCCPKFCQKLRLSTMKAAGAVALLYAALRSLRHFFPAMRSTQPYYTILLLVLLLLPHYSLSLSPSSFHKLKFDRNKYGSVYY